jgi:hypothetical protein
MARCRRQLGWWWDKVDDDARANDANVETRTSKGGYFIRINGLSEG